MEGGLPNEGPRMKNAVEMNMDGAFHRPCVEEKRER